MDATTIDLSPFTQLIGTLGAFVVVIWLYVKEKVDHRTTLKDKDDHIREINAKVLDAFEKNATVNQALGDTIKENTKATKSLTERVTDVLINGNK